MRRALAGMVLSLLCAGPVAADVCTILADAGTGAILVRDGTVCDRRAPPQSTFKLPLALMGFDSGILLDAHTPRWDYRPDYGGVREVEKTAHDPASWQAVSVVWYSQQLTRRLGAERFAAYVSAFGYGNRNLAGDPGKNNGLARAWLSSSLRISPDEQIAFLLALRARTLPVSAHAYAMTDAAVPRFRAGDWQVQGKTGSGWLRGGDGKLDKSRPLGWFVGWARRSGREIVFARLLLENRPLDMPASFLARDGLLADLPRLAD